MAESQRNYSRLQDIWKMVSRTAYEQLNHSYFAHNFNFWNDNYLFITIY